MFDYFRYAPPKACKIIMACIVLHNIANDRRLPLPDAAVPAEEGNNDEGCNQRHTVTGRATREALVVRYFTWYVMFEFTVGCIRENHTSI